MSDGSATAELSSQSDPRQDRPARPIPQNIADILAILQILLTYGRHLSATLEHRAVARGFSVIAQFFGTASVPAIRARLSRGLLRVTALQRVLLARAARGRDLVFCTRRPRPAVIASKVPPLSPDAAAQPPAPPPVRRPGRDAPPDPANPPTLAQLEAQIRRRPLGQTIADICRDLGVSPSLCEGSMWNALFFAITWYRGNLPHLMKDFRRRKMAFEPEIDRNPSLGLPEETRDGIRRMLGFFIGEEPATPAWVPVPPAVVAAASTGPP